MFRRAAKLRGVVQAIASNAGRDVVGREACAAVHAVEASGLCGPLERCMATGAVQWELSAVGAQCSGSSVQWELSSVPCKHCFLCNARVFAATLCP